MSKLLSVTLAMTLALAAFLLLASGHDKAGAQSGPFYINAVDIDVVPGQIDAYLAALKREWRRCRARTGLSRVQHHGFAKGPKPRVHLRSL